MADHLHDSKRFKTKPTRRDFLGLAAAWSAILSLVLAVLGAMRLPMPSVFPESNSRVKLGPPERFAVGSATYFPQQKLWLYRTSEGFHAISAVCTHLGCIALRSDDGQFLCPCHGSRFGAEGAVTGGPAPKGLVWLELSVSPEGQLIADTLSELTQGKVFAA